MNLPFGSSIVRGYADILNLLATGLNSLFQRSVFPQVAVLCPITAGGDNLWNIGVWSHNKKKELKKLYFELEKKFFNEESFIYDRKPQGRVIGAGKFVMPDDSRAFCIGDCALSANSLSGEGISYALESGINVSNLIASQITGIQSFLGSYFFRV